MSSSVCQGLQSCLDPRLVDPRVHRLKLAPPRRPSADDCHAMAKMRTAVAQPGPDAADWSFLRAFSPVEEKCEGEVEQRAVYVHPLLKCSSSFLSDWSLSICTEVLGSETGNDLSDEEAPLLLLPGGSDGYCRSAIRPATTKKLSRSSSFPPPLTSVGGSTGVQVQSRREGGRLVVEAVAVSSPRSFLHTERSHGHLRVRFSSEGTDALETEAEEEEEEEKEEKEAEAEGEEAREEEVEEEEEDCDHEELEEEGEGMEGNSGFVGGEIGSGKCLRPRMRWCKEGAAMNWKPKPCWVAT